MGQYSFGLTISIWRLIAILLVSNHWGLPIGNGVEAAPVQLVQKAAENVRTCVVKLLNGLRYGSKHYLDSVSFLLSAKSKQGATGIFQGLTQAQAGQFPDFNMTLPAGDEVDALTISVCMDSTCTSFFGNTTLPVVQDSTNHTELSVDICKGDASDGTHTCDTRCGDALNSVYCFSSNNPTTNYPLANTGAHVGMVSSSGPNGTGPGILFVPTSGAAPPSIETQAALMILLASFYLVHKAH